MRFTVTPNGLRLPSLREIRSVARREGVRTLNESEIHLVLDMICRALNVGMEPFDEPFARVWITDQNLVKYGHGTCIDRKVEYLRNVHAIVRDLDLNTISGPPDGDLLVRAVRLIKLLRSCDRSVLVAYVIADAEFLLRMLREAIAEGKALSQTQIESLQNLMDGDPTIDQVQQKAAEFRATGVDLTELCEICRQLEGIKEWQDPESPPRPDPDGDDMHYRGIDNLGELPRASMADMALPSNLMLYRAVNGDTGVRETISRADDKQLLYVLLDGTSSMRLSDQRSRSRAAGVVLNRLRAVVDGETVLYLRFFDHALREMEYVADSPESAEELMKVVTNVSHYDGGSTNFVEPLKSAAERIMQLIATGDLRDPEVVMVTDGQAMTPDYDDLRGLKLHVVHVGYDVENGLSALAVRSGGASIDASGVGLQS